MFQYPDGFSKNLKSEVYECDVEICRVAKQISRFDGRSVVETSATIQGDMLILTSNFAGSKPHGI